ncbi:hypothetical protein ACFFWD_28905 [Bradyrhizobium erythrophlei]|uniref:hypothetical protein n=1 Tax=Bradyrhizobium erythrophlei TaxID=1437360 RepID=UPI0035E8B753
MQSTLSMKDADPHDIFAIEPNFAPVAPTDKPTIAPEPAGLSGQREPHFGPAVPPSTPPLEPPVRAITLDDLRHTQPDHGDIKLGRASPSRGRWAIRAFFFVFAIGSAVAAAAWEHYGDRARQLAAEWTPQIAQLSSLLPSRSAPAADQQSAPAVQAAAADQAAAQPAPAAQQQDTAAVAPAAAAAAAPVPAPAAAAPIPMPAVAAAPALTPEQTQLLQSMARDLASMGQQIEQLKTSIDQLKTSQDQLSQRVAKTAEARPADAKPAAVNPALPPRPRAAATAPRAAVAPPPAPLRRPVQAYIPPPLPAATAPQAASVQPRPAPPPQAGVVDADDEPVVRPPMPLR